MVGMTPKEEKIEFKEIHVGQSAITGKESDTSRASQNSKDDHRAKNLGRNDPCFCASGKKFKKCHGA